MPETLYEHAGGAPAMLALARAHHARCLADPQVSHPFTAPEVNPRHEERLAAYFGQVLGGPPAYSGAEGGSQVWLQRRHAHQGGEGEFGHRFLDCFRAALDDAALPADAPFRSAVTAYMEWAVADVLAYAPRDAVVPPGLQIPCWDWDSVVTVAIDNNAVKVDGVTRDAGIVTHRDGRRWWADSRTPKWHPDAQTLVRGTSPGEILDGIDTGPGCSVKDSWADLDLAPHGFTVIVEGSWLWRGAARDTGSAAGWEWTAERDAWTARRGDEIVARCIITRSDRVVGVTDLDAGGGDRTRAWRELAAALGAACPNAPVVAWEPDADLPAALAAGFAATGPLRVWERPPTT